MLPFCYRKGKLYCEEIRVEDIARKVGTPFYLYSQSSMTSRFRAFDDAFRTYPHLTCYAVKANSNLAILSLFRALGAGFDVVSKGELMRAFHAGMDPGKIIFSGVGKTEDEIDLALHRGILQFNVESAAELVMLEARARTSGNVAPIALRINPDVDPGTHPYIATGGRSHKFGIPSEEALDLYSRARCSPHLRITGVGCHIGSQVTSLGPFVREVRHLKEIFLALRASGIGVRNLDMGGGLGIVYHEETPPEPREYARAILNALKGVDCMLVLEPGRVIAGNSGILVTRVTLTKRSGAKDFVVVDAGMSDLLRPSLYGSYHRIQPLTRTRRRSLRVDVVGPICESGDFFAHARSMQRVKAGEMLAVMSAGAYGFVLASNYNSRLRPAEVLVRGRRVKVIRCRERFQNLIRDESSTPL